MLRTPPESIWFQIRSCQGPLIKITEIFCHYARCEGKEPTAAFTLQTSTYDATHQPRQQCFIIVIYVSNYKAASLFLFLELIVGTLYSNSLSTQSTSIIGQMRSDATRVEKYQSPAKRGRLALLLYRLFRLLMSFWHCHSNRNNNTNLTKHNNQSMNSTSYCATTTQSATQGDASGRNWTQALKITMTPSFYDFLARNCQQYKYYSDAVRMKDCNLTSCALRSLIETGM